AVGRERDLRPAQIRWWTRRAVGGAARHGRGGNACSKVGEPSQVTGEVEVHSLPRAGAAIGDGKGRGRDLHRAGSSLSVVEVQAEEGAGDFVPDGEQLGRG